MFIELLIWSAGTIAGSLLWWRMPRLPHREPQPVKHGRAISIIIPARNEAANLPGLLASLAHQTHPPGEILVVDDHSTDGTGALARKGGARVITSRPLPAGWTGKNWACRQGADAAKGTLLLFLDADIQLEPEGIAALLAAHDNTGGAVSAAPWHKPGRPYEELSAFFNAVIAGGMRSFAFPGGHRPAGMFGPCLLLSRTAYQKAGTHEAVRLKILEHYFFTRHLLAAGIPVSLFSGKGAVHIRMYPAGLCGLANGWAKAWATGAGNTPLPILLSIIFWMAAGLGIPVSALLRIGGTFPGTPIPFLILYGVYALSLFRIFRMVGRFSPFTALFYPVALLFHLGIFFRSLLYKMTGRRLLWKARPGGEGVT